MRRTDVLGIKVDALTKSEAEDRLVEIVDGQKQSFLFTPNPEMVVRAQGDKEFRVILNRGDLNLADGIGLLFAARFQTLPVAAGSPISYLVVFCQWLFLIMFLPPFPHFFTKPIPERITGSDFIWNIARVAARRKLRLFLLGGGPAVAERCALVLQTNVPDLRIAGVYSGPSAQAEEIVRLINKSRADILLVAFGAPRQEKWLSDNLVKTKCRLGAGLGGTFDFIAGVKSRAPRWIQRLGLEWFYRLLQ